MATESTFKELIDSNFKVIADQVTELYNERPEKQQYYFKGMLTQAYSVDNSFASTDIKHNIKAADVVALDSSLPLKNRSAIRTYMGELPKLGMKMSKNERDVRNLMTLVAQNPDKQNVLSALFNDLPDCIDGVNMRLEIMFLQALSTGIAITTADNNGTGVRVDYGYLSSHKKKAATAWTSTSATPITDITDTIEAARAEGYKITSIKISKKYFDYLRKTDEAKMFYAQFNGLNPATATNLVTPLATAMAQILGTELGVEIDIIDSLLRVEGIDGKSKNITAWQEENVIFTQQKNVGRLVYGTTVEEQHPVSGVSYTKSDNYILLSMYGETDPFAEITASQAYALPVIDNPSSVFVLNALAK